MKHDILGEVGQSNSQPFDAVATIRHGSQAAVMASGYPSISIARSIRAAGLPRALFRINQIGR
jgi:hypothetical protein